MGPSLSLCYTSDMREKVRERLTDYRADALQSIEDALNRTKSELSGKGRANSHAWYRAINKDYEGGLGQYMYRSTVFIRHVAPTSYAEFAGELRDAANELK